MKNIIKGSLLFCLLSIVSCNNAEYSKLGQHAYITESVNSSSKSTKVTITDNGVNAEITACLSSAATEDVTLKFVVDPAVLDSYNKTQASSYVVLPETGFEMETEVVIRKGDYTAAPTKIHIKPLAEELIGETYAIPLRLVSECNVPTTTATSTFVVTTEAITTSSYPMFEGGAAIMCSTFQKDLPNFTIEARFQVSNTSARNRAVFTGGPVLLRFEDPQSNTADHNAHSLVQFQGEGWYLNPMHSFAVDKWQHLALTYDGKAVTLYVNGQFSGTKEGTNRADFGSLSWFGGDGSGDHGAGNSWWRGCKILVSELRVWSVCRSEAQIVNNMTTTSAKSEGLEGYWRMDDGEGSTFKDYSGNGNDMTSAESITWIENIKSSDVSTPWAY